jgi:hypothetical protein
MQIVITVEPRPKGHLIIGSIIERIAKTVMGEHSDRGEFILRSSEGGEVIEHEVKWGIWP